MADRKLKIFIEITYYDNLEEEVIDATEAKINEAIASLKDLPIVIVIDDEFSIQRPIGD